jgi:FixJ family two-component response regulator
MENNDTALVYVVDDDSDIRALLEAVLSSQGYKVQKFVSGAEFLANCDQHSASCVLTDVRMPGLDGFELQEEITKRGIPAGTVMITGYADVALAVRAIKAGVIDVLQKPFCQDRLLALVPVALENGHKKLQALREQRRADMLLRLLTPREYDVAKLVVAGHGSKAIAKEMNLSPRTIEFHRARLMNKLQISTVAALIKIVSMASEIPSAEDFGGSRAGERGAGARY